MNKNFDILGFLAIKFFYCVFFTIIFGATINEEYNGELKITVVATGFDETSNTQFAEARIEAPKSNAFGRRSVTDSRVIPAAQKTAPKDDLDVPSFLRKKM